MLRKEGFYIEDSPIFQGYTYGTTWNGWQMPYFEKDEALNVADAFGGWYDADADSFCFPYLDGTNEIESFPGEIIEFDGTFIRVYAIGNGCWVWD